MTLEFSQKIFKKTSWKSVQLQPSCSKWTDMTKLTFIFHNFVNVPKTGKINGFKCYVVNANILTRWHAPQNSGIIWSTWLFHLRWLLICNPKGFVAKKKHKHTHIYIYIYFLSQPVRCGKLFATNFIFVWSRFRANLVAANHYSHETELCHCYIITLV